MPHLNVSLSPHRDIQKRSVSIAIGIGARVGDIAMGLAGGLGVLMPGPLGTEPGSLPLVVIAAITIVIVAMTAMQVAGGMDFIVGVADRILHNNPRNLALLGSLATCAPMSVARTALAPVAVMPVIADVAKDDDERRLPVALGTIRQVMLQRSCSE